MSQRRVATGVFWLVSAELIFVAAWCAIKYLGSRLPLFEIIFFRATISLIVLLPLSRFRLKSFKGRDLSTLFLRSLFGFLAMIMSFYAMIHMKVGNAATLFNTLPIFVALLSPSLLGEPFSRKQFIFVITAFAGIAMILRPDPNIFSGAAIYALLAGLLASIAMICIRKLAATDSAYIITLYFTAFSALCSLPLAAKDFMMPTSSEWFWLAFIGFAVTFAQLFMTRAYKFGRASTIAPFTYSAVIGAYAAGLILFDEVPGLLSLAGALVIVGSGIGVMLTAPHPVKERKIPPQGVI